MSPTGPHPGPPAESHEASFRCSCSVHGRVVERRPLTPSYTVHHNSLSANTARAQRQQPLQQRTPSQRASTGSAGWWRPTRLAAEGVAAEEKVKLSNDLLPAETLERSKVGNKFEKIKCSKPGDVMFTEVGASRKDPGIPVRGRRARVQRHAIVHNAGPLLLVTDRRLVCFFSWNKELH